MSQTQNATIAMVGIDIGKTLSTSWATMSVARLCCVRNGRVARSLRQRRKRRR